MAKVSGQRTVWKPISLWSAFLVSLCVAAGYVDVLTHFRFEFISDHYDVIGIAGLVGAMVCIVALIGWARHLGRRGRLALALSVLLWPWAMCLVGYPIDGVNPHGAAAPLLVSIAPASILSFALCAVAAAAQRNT